MMRRMIILIGGIWISTSAMASSPQIELSPPVVLPTGDTTGAIVSVDVDNGNL